jgi:hypothetical protein
MSFFKSMLQDGHDGSWSSKRVITLLAFVIVSVSYLADQFTQYKATQTLFDSIIYLVIAGLGFTASEKFAKKDKPNE